MDETKKLALKGRPQDCVPHDPRGFWNIINYRTDHPKEALEQEWYFDPCRMYLLRGDEIRAACMRDDGTWDKAVFEVVSSPEGGGHVVVELITPWRHGGNLVIRGLVAKHQGHGVWFVRDDSGLIIAKGLSKIEAEHFVVSPDASKIDGESVAA